MEEQIQNILNQYEISEKNPVVFIRESSDNIIYSIGDKEKNILRISKRLPLNDIQFEFDALSYLFSKGVMVPKWIKTKNDNFYASTSDISTAILFDFIEGVHVERTVEKMPTEIQAYEAGKALALLHNTGQDFSSEASRSRDIFSELRRGIKNKDTFVKEYEGGEKFINEINDAILFAENSLDPKGFIHHDYRVGNVFFQKDDSSKIKGVIDFDWSCKGPLVKDLGLALMEWSFADGEESPDYKIMDSFLNGYNSESNCKIEKSSNLYNWMWFSGLSDTATWLCDNISNPDFIKNVNRSYMYQKAQFFKSLVN
jgi:Ser/Thr protein kinase RdoA (MazF antagonist)